MNAFWKAGLKDSHDDVSGSSTYGGAACRKAHGVAHFTAWCWTGYDPSAGAVQVHTDTDIRRGKEENLLSVKLFHM